jgi:P-type conjugative transfer protein TrbJ
MNNLRQLTDIQQKVRGITYEFGNVENAFDQHYPNMSAYNGMSGKDFSVQAAKANQQLQNSVRDAMLAQGLISNSKSDQEALNALVSASNKTDGQLAAAQAGNQIAAVTAQQLIQLQQILSTSAREQSSYMATVAAEKAKAIRDAAAVLDTLYRSNVFPSMKIGWGTYPNHIGHESSPGCFRCHDDAHKTAEGKTISQDCSTCHSLLAMQEENPEILKSLEQ